MSVRPICQRSPAAGDGYGGGVSTGFTVMFAPKSPLPMNAPFSHVWGNMVAHTGSFRARKVGQSTLSPIPPSMLPPEPPVPPELLDPPLELPAPLLPELA